MSVFKGLFVLNLFVLTLICNGQQTPKDWLIDNSGFKATIEQAENGKDLVLTNGRYNRSKYSEMENSG